MLNLCWCSSLRTAVLFQLSGFYCNVSIAKKCNYFANPHYGHLNEVPGPESKKSQTPEPGVAAAKLLISGDEHPQRNSCRRGLNESFLHIPRRGPPATEELIE